MTEVPPQGRRSIAVPPSPDPGTQRALRDQVRGLLAGVDPNAVDAAVLVVDELVNNAYQHTGRPHALRLERTAQGRCLWVEVDDGALATPPRFSQRRKQPHGYGLTLVTNLAAAWGVRLRASGKTMWAEVDLALD